METHSLEEFNAEARRFASEVKPRTNEATIVALSGDLGAGKTTFVQEVAKSLGVEESVTSPTFVIEKVYKLNPFDSAQGRHAFQRLIHIDAYRLNSEHELEVLGWHEIAADPSNLILIEWPEKVPALIPEDAIKIRFDTEGETRTIIVSG